MCSHAGASQSRDEEGVEVMKGRVVEMLFAANMLLLRKLLDWGSMELCLWWLLEVEAETQDDKLLVKNIGNGKWNHLLTLTFLSLLEVICLLSSHIHLNWASCYVYTWINLCKTRSWYISPSCIKYAGCAIWYSICSFSRNINQHSLTQHTCIILMCWMVIQKWEFLYCMWPKWSALQAEFKTVWLGNDSGKQFIKHLILPQDALSSWCWLLTGKPVSERPVVPLWA